MVNIPMLPEKSGALVSAAFPLLIHRIRWVDVEAGSNAMPVIKRFGIDAAALMLTGLPSVPSGFTWN